MRARVPQYMQTGAIWSHRRAPAARGLVAVTLAAAVAAGVPAGAYSRPGHVVRVSLTSAGQQANDDSGYDRDSGAQGLAITPDGRYVAFVSAATNLGASGGAGGGKDQYADVYVRDLRTGRTRIASVASDGSRGVGLPKGSGGLGCYGADYPSISADGRYVAFTSCYVNLTGTGHDTNTGTDVFVHDMRTGKTTMVSVSSTGAQQRVQAWQSMISPDGRYVVFTSSDGGTLDGPACDNALTPVGFGNLLQCDFQVYVHDMKTARTWRVSETTGGAPGDGPSYAPSISADGRYVVFTSEADNLVPNDSNKCLPTRLVSCPDVYLHDLKTGRNELISVALDGQAPLGSSPQEPLAAGYSGGAQTGDAFYPTTISADDRYVVFGSNATDLVPSTPPTIQLGVYVRDRVLGRTMRVSVDSAGQPLNVGGWAANVPISANGRFVVLPSTCSMHDLVTGATYALPLCGAGTAMAYPRLTADGRRLAFASDLTNLVANDTNKAVDVFVYDQGPAVGTATIATASAGAASASSASMPGLRLVGARVVARPQSRDLFFQIDVDDMPPFATASPAVVYGVDFGAGGRRYELRAGKVGPVAAFGLFRRDAGGWTQVATVRGGYGTTGQSVVAAVPIAALSSSGAVTATDVVAFSSLGGYRLGAVTTIDRIRLGSLD
jgi:Tol biopolymer transport system component